MFYSVSLISTYCLKTPKSLQIEISNFHNPPQQNLPGRNSKRYSSLSVISLAPPHPPLSVILPSATALSVKTWLDLDSHLLGIVPLEGIWMDRGNLLSRLLIAHTFLSPCGFEGFKVAVKARLLPLLSHFTTKKPLLRKACALKSAVMPQLLEMNCTCGPP